ARSLHSGVIRLEAASRCEQERILAVRQFSGSFVTHDGERRRGSALLALFPQALVEEGRTGVRLVGARPLDAAELFESRVAHSPRKLGSDRAELIPHLLRGRGAPVVAEAS